MKSVVVQAAGMKKSHGFTLVELMVALTLGLLVSVGLISLFVDVGKANRYQAAMAHMQESGRFALQRMSFDLRLTGRQSTQNTTGYAASLPTSASEPNGAVGATVAADVYVASLPMPDIATPLTAPVGWPAATPWPLSQRHLIQGYECTTGTCSPTVPSGSNGLPAAGTGVGQRLPNADVLTVRYLNAEGWSVSRGEVVETTNNGSACQGGNLVSLTVTPAAGSPTFNFKTNDYALLVAGARAVVFQVQVTGAVLTPINVLSAIPCFAQPTASSGASTSATVYNLSQDFITATYYLRFAADPNTLSRTIPVLVRRQSTMNTVAGAANDQVIVQGAEQLDFLYGVDWRNGVGSAMTTSYLTADDGEMKALSSAANCPDAPYQYQQAGFIEPECLWRAVKNVEVHLLLDSVTDLNLNAAEQSYHYSSDGSVQPAAPPASTLPSGVAPGSMLRREFVALIAVRNYNP